MAQEELQESKLTKAGGRTPTHGCNYPMVGWPSVILTPMGPSLNLTREGTSRPSLRSSLSLMILGYLSVLGCMGGGIALLVTRVLLRGNPPVSVTRVLDDVYWQLNWQTTFVWLQPIL